jgi:hypothetical protein
MQGRERTVVTSIHCLQHVDRFGAATFTNYDAVGAHAQSIAHEISDGYLRFGFGSLLAGFKSAKIHLVQLELCRVFYADHALIWQNKI